MTALSKVAVAGVCLCFAAACLQARASVEPGNHAQVVFRVGTFDRSSGEFSSGQPTQTVDFLAGQSSVDQWYGSQAAGVQPAPGAPAADPSTAPRTITFSLDHSPSALYRLHLSVLLESASVPVLRIGVDQKQGTLYLHPRLGYSNGDQNDSYNSVYSHADVVVDIPGAELRKGSNTITLQVLAQAGGVIPGASLNYDAIELDREARGSSRLPPAQILPSVFYQQHAGQLEEIIDVLVRHANRVRTGDAVELVFGGKRYRQTLRGTDDFGEEELKFPVPAFSDATKAQLRWCVGGHSDRLEEVIHPAKKWTVFLVPHIHVDVGYSDYQAKVAAIQSRAIGEALEMIAKQPDFRFSLDGEWDLQQFLETRTPEQKERALRAIQARRLFVPAQYANLLTGFPTAETLIRSLYPSANFSRTYGTPFDYANITDVPSYSWSYASILAAAGIHYLAAATNSDRAPVLLQARLNEQSPYWWQGPDGQKVLMWESRGYAQMQNVFGGPPPVLASGEEMLPVFLQQYERPGYRADAAILYGSQVENTDLFPQQAALAAQWNSRYAYPHIQYSGFHEALTNIAGQLGSSIPTLRGDGGPYWEDGIGSDAHFAAMERWNEPRALSAEKLDTLSTLVDPQLAADTSKLDRMWTNMVLMDEHTWDSSDSVSAPTSTEAVNQLAVKDRYAVNAQALADFLVRGSMANLAQSIHGGPGSLIVFNTLNWPRSGFINVDLPDGDAIVDTAGRQAVPYTILRSGNGFRHVQFTAAQVPAVGYRVYTLQASTEKPPAVPIEHTTVMESPYYRVTLDPSTGAVQSIYDRQLHRELVSQQSPYRFGQYLYVSGGDKAPNTLLHYSPVYPAAHLAVHGAAEGKLVSVEHTPYGSVARMESEDTNTPSIQTEVRLFDHEKKIELLEDVTKKEVYTREAVYFAFPFAMSRPQFQYEVQNGVVDPAQDMYPGAGHEWFSVQHWVAVQQDGASATVMPLDASLVTLGDINRGAWPATFGARRGTIFSYVMNNYWHTNYRAGQGGDFRFHYVITSAQATEPAKLSRMGWEAVTPLEHDEVTTQDKAVPLPASAQARLQSFVDVQDPALLLETWKHAEDGNGTILRFLDLGGAQRTVTVRVPALRLQAAWEADAVERNHHPLQLSGTDGFTFTVHPHAIVTVRLVTH